MVGVPLTNLCREAGEVRGRTRSLITPTSTGTVPGFGLAVPESQSSTVVKSLM